ncbi:MAG: hypothetical protein ACLGHC_01810 [Alphaproteobacteria bacterium]
MGMTFEEACKVRLPSGKAIGEASPADWKATERFFREEGARYDKMSVEEFARSEDRELAAAFFEQKIEWEEAMLAVWSRIAQVAETDETRAMAERHVTDAKRRLDELPELIKLARSNG